MHRGKFALKIHPSGDHSKTSLHLESDNALSFLELIDKEEDGLTVQQTTKFFNVEEDYGHLQLMARLSKTIRDTRLQYYGGVVEDAALIAFYDLDREQLQGLREITTFSITK